MSGQLLELHVQGWADLPDHGILHPIITLLLRSGSYRELYAMAATCRSWRAAFCTAASSSSSTTLIPPLLLQPDNRAPRRPGDPFRSNLVPNCPCRLTGIANDGDDDALRCEISLSPPVPPTQQIWVPPAGQIWVPPDRQIWVPWVPRLESFGFRGASYGHLVLSSGKFCMIVDVFSGATVSPPPLPPEIVFKDPELRYGGLTAPLSSPGGSYLVVDTGSQNLLWRVGSRYWTRPNSSPDSGRTISRVVVFKGEIFGMDASTHTLLKVDLAAPPGQIDIREVRVHGGPREICGRRYGSSWLVACDDMLLMVACRGALVVTGETFQAFRLDTSVHPPAWVEVERLGNRAVFLSTDRRCQPLWYARPEAWGGRSNCVYLYNHERKRWVAFELGKPLQGDVFVFTSSDSGLLHPLWVVPSMLYLRP